MILFPFKVKRYKIVESHADHLDYVKLIIESRNIIGATTILMMTKLTLYADNVVITYIKYYKYWLSYLQFLFINEGCRIERLQITLPEMLDLLIGVCSYKPVWTDKVKTDN